MTILGRFDRRIVFEFNYNTPTDNNAFGYDAIFVDEGNDLQPLWWKTLRTAHHAQGQVLFIADMTQDLYHDKQNWTETTMREAGFRGPWVQLESSYRLPESYASHIRKFGNLFLSNQAPDLPPPKQIAPDLEPCTTRWIQISDIATTTVINQLAKAIMHMRSIAGDEVITVIVSNKECHFALYKRVQHKSFYYTNASKTSTYTSTANTGAKTFCDRGSGHNRLSLAQNKTR